MRFPLVLCVALGAAAVFPAGAVAGKTVINGNDKAGLTVDLSAQKGAAKKSRGVKLRYRVVRGTVDGTRSAEDDRSIVITAPKGLRINSNVVPQCDAFTWATVDSYECPAGAALGTGSSQVDARPTLPSLVNAPLKAFNADDNLGPDSTTKVASKPGVLLQADLGGGNAVGVDLALNAKGKITLQAAQPAPGTRSTYSIINVDITISALGKNKKPFAQAPATCPKNRKWRFTMVEKFWSGKTITATHDASCKKF